jgi:hypothetical protein
VGDEFPTGTDLAEFRIIAIEPIGEEQDRGATSPASGLVEIVYATGSALPSAASSLPG